MPVCSCFYYCKTLMSMFFVHHVPSQILKANVFAHAAKSFILRSKQRINLVKTSETAASFSDNVPQELPACVTVGMCWAVLTWANRFLSMLTHQEQLRSSYATFSLTIKFGESRKKTMYKFLNIYFSSYSFLSTTVRYFLLWPPQFPSGSH